jgi:hypothetical protein
MRTWDVDETRNAIERKFGRDQLELARPCLRSLSDRQFYARFHYQRAGRTMERYFREHLHSKGFIEISLGVDEAEWNRFNIVVRKLGADLTACVQSLHSIPDILASAVYYSLQLDKQFTPPPGRYVNHAFVSDGMAKLDPLRPLNTLLRSVVAGQGFKHLAALANQSKHYSIVFPALNVDLTGERKEQYMLAFPEFTARRKVYPQTFILDLLPPIHEHLSRCVVQTGHTLNALLGAAQLKR